MTLFKWLRQAEVDEGSKPGVSRGDSAELREARKRIKLLARHGLSGSMGRVGAAGDNAAMESFFALLQDNVLNRRTWSTRDEPGPRSSPGSNAPTTAADPKPASAG